MALKQAITPLLSWQNAHYMLLIAYFFRAALEVFLTLLFKLLPLYLIMGLGFVAVRALKVDRQSIARLLIYMVAPAVVFYGVSQTPLSWAMLSLPFLFFILCTSICLLFLGFGSLVWGKESTRNLLAYAAGDGNTGYFGIPVAMILFSEEVLGIVVLALLGFILFENTVGFFTMARGNYTLQDSLRRMKRLPAVYAFIAGIAVAATGWIYPQPIVDFFQFFKSSYSLLGMMVIGMGLATATRSSFDAKFIGIAFFAKFVLWPLIVFGLISLDKSTVHFYNQDIYDVMVLMAIVPLAANTVTFSTELKVHPEKAAVAVSLSTVFALAYIPLVVLLYLR